MHQTRLQIQSSKLLKEVHDYSKELQQYGTIGGLVSIGIFFCTKTFYIISTSTVSFWVFKYPDLMRAICLLSPAYTVMLLGLVCLKWLLQEFYFSGNSKATSVRLIKSVVSFLLYPFELSIFGVKSIIVITYSFRPEYRDLFKDSNGNNGAFYLFAMIITYADFVVSIGVCYIKNMVLKPFLPNGGFFSKVDSIFETCFILFIPLKHLFFYLTTSNDLVSSEGIVPAANVNWTFYAVELFLMAAIVAIYLKELPYYNPFSEKILAHFLFTTFWVFLLIGATSKNLDLTLKILLFVLPLQIVALEYYLAYVYRIDYMNPSQMKEAKFLKQVISDAKEKISKNIFEQLYSQGVFINHIKKKRVINLHEETMWLNVQKFKEDPNLTSTVLEEGSELIIQQKISAGGDAMVNQELVHRGSSSGKDDTSSTKTKIEQIIVNSYVDNNKKEPFAHLVRLYWTMNNRLVVFNIFQDLRDLLELATSFKAKFIYFYALKEVEDYLQSLYRNPEMINLESESDLFSTSVITGKRASDSEFLDIAYPLYQKYTIQYLRMMIESYASKNSKFIEDLSLGSTTYKVMHSRIKELHNFNKKISKCFEGYNANSKNTENHHILPYCLHLCYSVNYLRSGKNLLAEYIKRSQVIARIQDEKNPIIMPDNLMIDTGICLVESEPGVIGNIVDVYGDTLRLLGLPPKSLIGKSPNYLIPTTMAQYHDKIMHYYMSKPLRYFMGIQRDSFIKIPETNYIVCSQIMFKLAPNFESGFKIIVVLKPNQKKHNHKMILNQNFQIDSYSHNFLTLLDEKCLGVDISVAGLSPALHKFIQRQVQELEGTRGDILRSKQKRTVVDQFNKYVGKELGQLEDVRLRKKRDREAKLEDSFENLMKKYSENEERLFASNIFELVFENRETKAQVKKVFEVTLEVKEFPDVDKRLYYLDMSLVDGNDLTVSNLLKDLQTRESRHDQLDPNINVSSRHQELALHRLGVGIARPSRQQGGDTSASR